MVLLELVFGKNCLKRKLRVADELKRIAQVVGPAEEQVPLVCQILASGPLFPWFRPHSSGWHSAGPTYPKLKQLSVQTVSDTEGKRLRAKKRVHEVSG